MCDGPEEDPVRLYRMAATDAAVGGLMLGVGLIVGLYIEVGGWVLFVVGIAMLVWSGSLLRRARVGPGGDVGESDGSRSTRHPLA